MNSFFQNPLPLQNDNDWVLFQDPNTGVWYKFPKSAAAVVQQTPVNTPVQQHNNQVSISESGSSVMDNASPDSSVYKEAQDVVVAKCPEPVKVRQATPTPSPVAEFVDRSLQCGIHFVTTRLSVSSWENKQHKKTWLNRGDLVNINKVGNRVQIDFPVVGKVHPHRSFCKEDCFEPDNNQLTPNVIIYGVPAHFKSPSLIKKFLDQKVGMVGVTNVFVSRRGRVSNVEVHFNSSKNALKATKKVVTVPKEKHSINKTKCEVKLGQRYESYLNKLAQLKSKLLK